MTKMPWRFSPEIGVMLRPQKTFAAPSLGAVSNPGWLGWRRPLFTVLIFSCCISLLTQSRLSLHIVGSTAIYWSLVPFTAIAGLAAVQRGWPKAQAVDRFFVGYAPWLLWMIAFAIYGPGAVGTPAAFTFWEVAAAVVLLWSCWIDYRFFGSAGKLLLHRAVSWTLFTAIFAGSWIWVEIAERLGL